jgi:acetyltransferase-like isoleucine patch superfamily enzyme
MCPSTPVRLNPVTGLGRSDLDQCGGLDERVCMSEYDFLPLRPVPLPTEAEEVYGRWLGSIDSALDDPECDRYALCREVLEGIFPVPQGSNTAAQVARMQLDARNATLEPEYYDELDVAKYDRVKPLIWMWEMFDRSPLAENIELGIRFRRVLAPRIFKSCGRNFKAFHHVKLSFGYNLEVGDNVVVHRHVLLDDRGGIRIGNGASISDFANVYSHSHDIVDGRLVKLAQTVIGDRVRITYHSTILAGVTLGENSMVGAGSIVTRDVPPGWVALGVPAKPIKQKPNREKAPPTTDPLVDD